MTEQPRNPLHGITLEMMLSSLVDIYGWDYLADNFRMNCFMSNPSIKSSLTFLRKTPWAREKIEQFYLYTVRKKIVKKSISMADIKKKRE